MNVNRKAFLDTIAFSELGKEVLALSDNGYNVIVGSTPQKLVKFASYVDHPRIIVPLVIHDAIVKSTAAGRYQILARYFDAYKKQLNLPDFGKDSQDKIAIQYLLECHALAYIDSGNFAAAIEKCAHIWASLPGAQYNQHVNKLADLQTAYSNFGGTLT
jgi:muramidase (phage lysozyme)